MVRHDLQKDLRRLFERLGKSVLLVTHDMAEAAFFSQNIVLMREGKIVQRGSYRDLIDAPAEQFVTDFVKAQRSLHDEAIDA
jgi:osmoprotectant transport system ATP-binding protein